MQLTKRQVLQSCQLSDAWRLISIGGGRQKLKRSATMMKPSLLRHGFFLSPFAD